MRAARDVLLTIFAGEQTRLAIDGGYIKDLPGGVGATWQGIFMDDPNVNAPPGFSFVVTTACPCANAGDPSCAPGGVCDPNGPSASNPILFAFARKDVVTNVLGLGASGQVTCMNTPPEWCP